MKNKVSSKDHQPIRFHRGQPHLAAPEKAGGEKDLNEGDPRKENVVDKGEDSVAGEKDKKEITNEEREIENHTKKRLKLKS